MKKRALSLLLVFAMILSFVPTTALAAGGEENEITISETPSTDNQEGEPSTSNDSVEPGEGDAVGTANTEDQTDSETGSDAEALSAGTAREGEAADVPVVLESGDISNADELRKAVKRTTTGVSDLTLTDDIDLTQPVYIERAVTLNLDGHTITSKHIDCHSTLFVWPEPTEAGIEVTLRNGNIVSEVGYYGVYVVGDVGTLNLEGLTITNNYKATGGAYGVIIDHKTTAKTTTTIVNVTNSKITGEGGIFVSGTSSQATATPPSNPTIEQINKNVSGIRLNVDKDSTVTTTSGEFAAISGQGLDRSNPSITIAGTIVGGTTSGIYLPQYGTTTVNAGAKISGETGIAMKSGKLIINGGTITGTGEYDPSPDKKSGGINSDGSAVFIESYAPPYAGEMEITIKDGATLKSNKSYALRENPNSDATAIESITIEDGAKLTSSTNTRQIEEAIQLKAGTNEQAGSDSKVFIKGGTYSHPVPYVYLKNTTGTDQPLVWQVGTGPYTYYAKWEDAQEDGATGATERIAEENNKTDLFITLNYNDGGKGTKDFAVTQRVASGGNTKLPEEAPHATDSTKVFVGWAEVREDDEDTSAEPEVYQPGHEFKTVKADINLVATWSDKGPEVTFVLPNDIGLTEGSINNLLATTEKNTYTVADKTKDATFQVTQSGSAANQEITVTSQIGSNAPQDLSKDETGNYVLPKTLFTGGVDTTITVTVSTADKKTVTFEVGETGVVPSAAPNDTSLTITGNTGVIADKTKPAKFQLTGTKDTHKYTVTYKVGTGTEVTLEPEDDVYTLPANLTDNVTVTVTATAKKTITFVIDETAKAQVTGVDTSSKTSNLTSASSKDVYVAIDDTKPISFTLTKAQNPPTLDADKGIIVSYKLKDNDTSEKPLSGKDGTYTLSAEDITGDIIVTVSVGATPVYTAPAHVSGSTSTTTITKTEVSANIEAAKAQDEPLTIKAKTETESTTVTKSEVTLGGDVVNAIVESTTSTETNVDLAVETDVGTVALPSETVSKIVDDNNLTAKDPLTVKVENQDDQIVGAIAETGATNLFDVSLMSGTKEVNAEDLGLTLRITLTFQIEIGLKNPKLYRFEDGKGIELSDVRYDPTTGKISGKTDHLSQFYVVIAPDTTIASILGRLVVTEGTGGVTTAEKVIVQVPSGEGQAPVISSTNITPTDENAKVTLYSNSTFTAEVPASGKTLNEGTNVVYAKVTNGGVDNQSTSYYEITVIKEAAETDCTIDKVLEQVITTVSGTGSQGEPYVVTVVSEKGKLTADDIEAIAENATVTLYTDDTFKTPVSGEFTLESKSGIATAYAKVSNGSNAVYYQIEVTGAAVATVVPEIKDGKVEATKPTGTGVTQKFAIVTNNPASTIASWNTAMTESDVEAALKKLENNSSSNLLTTDNPPSGLANDKYVVVVNMKNGKIVSAGSVKVQLPVTVTIDSTGLATGDTLTVTNGSTAVTNSATYGDILTLKLSNANYVVYAKVGSAKKQVVPMNGTDGEGTYKVVGDTTFSVEAALPVTLTADPKSQLEVQYDKDGSGDKYLVDGTNMVPQGARLNIVQNGTGNYILTVNGERKDLSKTTPAIVDVEAATTIEVVPAYEVTINPNGVSNVILTVEVDGTTINNGDWVTKDTELTITFIHGANDTHKVQINSKDVTFSNNTAVHTVTADTEIEVVSQDAPSAVDELNVAVSTSGDVTVTKGSTPVNDAKFFVVSTPPDFTELKNNQTEDEVVGGLTNATSVTPPLAATDNNKILVALQISDGKVIAAGYSDPIKVSSPTTTTGYTVSGTVEKGNTNLETVAGILVTLKGANETKTTTVKADGTYEFVGVDAGMYDLEIALNAASKYDAVNQKVTVGTENVTVPTITLALVDDSNASTVWGDLKVESEGIGTSSRATFTVSNIKAGMYYCITITTGDAAPTDQFFQADKDFWSFVTANNSTIFVTEFASAITFRADTGLVDTTDNSQYRIATYVTE